MPTYGNSFFENGDQGLRPTKEFKASPTRPLATATFLLRLSGIREANCCESIGWPIFSNLSVLSAWWSGVTPFKGVQSKPYAPSSDCIDRLTILWSPKLNYSSSGVLFSQQEWQGKYTLFYLNGIYFLVVFLFSLKVLTFAYSKSSILGTFYIKL